jgi:hypothetical protein
MGITFKNTITRKFNNDIKKNNQKKDMTKENKGKFVFNESKSWTEKTSASLSLTTKFQMSIKKRLAAIGFNQK